MYHSALILGLQIFAALMAHAKGFNATLSMFISLAASLIFAMVIGAVLPGNLLLTSIVGIVLAQTGIVHFDMFKIIALYIIGWFVFKNVDINMMMRRF